MRSVSKFLYRSYVAIGDSLSEGLGDFDFDASRCGRGWADRLAGLLALEADQHQEEFFFGNYALRGGGMLEILTAQLEDALKAKPDLVTIMAGSNDIMCRRSKHSALESLLRGAISRLLDAGCHVLVVNTIHPTHLRVFRPMARKARVMSQLIERVSAEFGVPVLDLFSMNEFSNLKFWSEDMVHFSGHGHIRVANKAADLLGLSSRIEEFDESQMAAPQRSLWHTLRWLWVYVLPFWGRRLRGASSGDGLNPKHLEPVQMICNPGERIVSLVATQTSSVAYVV
ncbi:MAG: hypothetical protein RL319_537 [Actinomycetota bacterium]